MTFNAPPNWPVPRGWSPPPNWDPPSSWPPAPPGWRFWPDEPLAAEDGLADDHSRGRWWKLSKGSLIAAVAAAVVVVFGFAFIFAIERPTGIELQPHVERASPTDNSAAPTWVDPGWGTTPLYIDFTAWNGFGGIDAMFTDNGKSVRLDTHDTTETWRTKWSGLISRLTTTCAARIVGRVRGISHTLGVPGGFGVGIGALGPGDPNVAELTGTAFQFDFGQRGYRSAIYPTDSSDGFAPAALDHEWHQVEVLINSESQTLTVDGRTVATTPGRNQCGQPFIRVWGGSAEFADFTVSPLG